MTIYQVIEQSGWQLPVQVIRKKMRGSFLRVVKVEGLTNGQELPGPPPLFNGGDVIADVCDAATGEVYGAGKPLGGAAALDVWMPYPNDGWFVEAAEIEYYRQERALVEQDRREMQAAAEARRAANTQKSTLRRA